MLVAVIGKQGSGKSTLANSIASVGFRKVSFATPIKRSFTELFGHDNYDRAWMQSYGESSRQVQDDIWITQANSTIEDYLPGNVVIDDTRYQNEVLGTLVPYITRLNGLVVKLGASDITRFMRRYPNAGITRNSAKAIFEAYGDMVVPPSYDGSLILFAAGAAGLDDDEMTKVWNWTQFQEHKSEVDLDEVDFSQHVEHYLELSSDALPEEDILHAVSGEIDLIQKEIDRAAKLI